MLRALQVYYYLTFNSYLMRLTHHFTNGETEVRKWCTSPRSLSMYYRILNPFTAGFSCKNCSPWVCLGKCFLFYGGWGRHTKLLVLCFLLSVDPRKQPSLTHLLIPVLSLVTCTCNVASRYFGISSLYLNDGSPAPALLFFLSFCFAGEPEELPLVVTELITYEYWELLGTRLTCPLPCWHLASWLQEACSQDGPPFVMCSFVGSD